MRILVVVWHFIYLFLFSLAYINFPALLPNGFTLCEPWRTLTECPNSKIRNVTKAPLFVNWPAHVAMTVSSACHCPKCRYRCDLCYQSSLLFQEKQGNWDKYSTSLSIHIGTELFFQLPCAKLKYPQTHKLVGLLESRLHTLIFVFTGYIHLVFLQAYFGRWWSELQKTGEVICNLKLMET